MSTKKEIKKAVKRANRLKLFTKKQNEAYENGTDAEKRVLICKDVIKALREKTLKAGWSYLDFKGQYSSRLNYDASFQKLLPKIEPCQVCAKGALFVCTVLRRNEAPVSAAVNFRSDGYNLSRTLGGVFTGPQLDDIERAFEINRNEEDGNTLVDRKKRLRAIMQHIVDNGGEFWKERFLHEYDGA